MNAPASLASPFLTLDEAAAYCRFDTCQHPVKAFRQWANRQAVPIVRRGRVLLVERRVLEAVLNPELHVRSLRAVR